MLLRLIHESKSHPDADCEDKNPAPDHVLETLSSYRYA
jgi:hypothetical protein